MSSPDAIDPDALSLMLERNRTDALPQTPFELLHHIRTRAIVARATVASIEPFELERALVGIDRNLPVNPTMILALLTSGKPLRDRQREEVDGMDWTKFMASVERQIAVCLDQEDTTWHDVFHDLIQRIPALVEELLESTTLMTLEEVWTFNQRTKGKPQYMKYREDIAQAGKKPKFDGQISTLTGNTLAINLLLAAIEQDDHVGLSELMQGLMEEKWKWKQDLQAIMKYIIHDPILHVSPEMLQALIALYGNEKTYYAILCDFIAAIMEDEAQESPLLARYTWCIDTLSRRALEKFDPNSPKNSPILSIGLHGTVEGLNAIVEVAIAASIEPKYIARQLQLITISQKNNEAMVARARALIEEKGWKEYLKV